MQLGDKSLWRLQKSASMQTMINGELRECFIVKPLVPGAPWDTLPTFFCAPLGLVSKPQEAFA